ncbi:MAG: trehalase family glycosidase [Puniceicoccaceae bacterium]
MDDTLVALNRRRGLWQELDADIRTSWLDSRRQAREKEIRTVRDVILPGDPDAHDADEVDSSTGIRDSLLYLPHPYLTPGGKEAAFSEMYAWDTFFINEGLRAHEHFGAIQDHLRNQLFLIDRYGFVLTGNRTYYLGRSQIPLGAEGARRYFMEQPDRHLMLQALGGFSREYETYWTADHHLTPTGLSTARDLLNEGLRPELAAEAEVFDFTAVFEGDVRNCTPIMINVALARAETALGWMASELGLEELASKWADRFEQRKSLINHYIWNEERKGYYEFQYTTGTSLPFRSLAMFMPLWAGIASPEQAQCLVSRHLPDFLLPFGCPFTDKAYPSPHPEFQHLQWSYPAAWPSFHLLLIEGLDAYGYTAEADVVASRLLLTILRKFEETGKLWEKYHAADGGIEIPVERYPTAPMQGWTAATVAILGRRFRLDK